MFNWVLDVPLKEIVSNLIKKVLAKAIPPAITCSKLTIETLEQGEDMFKVTTIKAPGVVLVSFFLTLNIFHTL